MLDVFYTVWDWANATQDSDDRILLVALIVVIVLAGFASMVVKLATLLVSPFRKPDIRVRVTIDARGNPQGSAVDANQVSNQIFQALQAQDLVVPRGTQEAPPEDNRPTRLEAALNDD